MVGGLIYAGNLDKEGGWKLQGIDPQRVVADARFDCDHHPVGGFKHVLFPPVFNKWLFD